MSKRIFFTLLVMLAIIALTVLLRAQNKHIVLQGEVDAPEVIITSKAHGRVTEQTVKRGDDVRAGQTLMILDSPELMAQYNAAVAAKNQALYTLEMSQNGTREETIKQLTATRDSAKADYQNAQNTYNRQLTMSHRGYISSQDLDDTRNKRETALHSLQSAQANLDEAKQGDRTEQRDVYQAQLQEAEQQLLEIKIQVDDLHVKAPVAGEVGPIPAEIGELLNTGSPLMTLIRLPDAYFIFNLREDILAHVRKGDSVSLRVPALNNQVVQATVRYIAPLGDFSTKSATRATGDFDLKTFEVRLYPDKPVTGLRQGMSALWDWQQ